MDWNHIQRNKLDSVRVRWLKTQMIRHKCLQLMTCLHFADSLHLFLINHIRLFVNGRQPNIWQCLSPFTRRTHTHTHTHSDSLLPASSVMTSVLHYMAMWFLLAAEIQSVRIVSHKNSKICIRSLPRDQTPMIQHFHWTESPFTDILRDAAFFSCEQWDF